MLQIIPVLDIQGGKVVHARGGDRQAYPLLESQLTSATNPAEVIADLLAWLPFPQFYIADLDAITQGYQQPEFYRDLTARFPQVEFWLDSGIAQQQDLAAYRTIQNLRLVIGSESLKQIELLSHKDYQQNLVLSLDRRHGRLLGHPGLLQKPALWPERVIVMSLDHVGANQGPAVDWLKHLQASRDDIQWYMAGGIRDQQDLLMLDKNKVAGALIASALHTGQLDRKSVAYWLKQEHRPS
jgi:phosphoribosylformimino-5-aminoimidazole carboxamide ribotide isomerase